MSELRPVFALCACLASCGQAQQPHAADPGEPLRGVTVAHDLLVTTAPNSGVARSNTLPSAAADHVELAAAAPHEAGCAPGMARVANYCIDRYEAYVVELSDEGRELPHSPYEPVDGLRVRAKVAEGVVPQGYISQVQAADACQNAGKRLCAAAEFSLACRGPDAKACYPYGGTRREPGKCNEGKGSAVSAFFGASANYGRDQLNDPRLNQWSGGLARTGAFTASMSPFGVFDLVGNLHEWGAEVRADGHGYFRGGYFGDAEINGPGCDYVTKAHAAVYHDYSTGFRCCAGVSE